MSLLEIKHALSNNNSDVVPAGLVRELIEYLERRNHAMVQMVIAVNDDLADGVDDLKDEVSRIDGEVSDAQRDIDEVRDVAYALRDRVETIESE